MRSDIIALSVGMTAVAATTGHARPPNIVLIVADDLGYGELGCYGQTKIRTPNLDRLAADGLRFTQFYAGAPVCAPSRCCLMTGKQPSRAVIRDNIEVKPEGQMALPAGTTTLARSLREAGYRTALVGKWGLGAPGSAGEPNRQGFDHFFGYLCQRHAHDYYPTYLWRNGKRVRLKGNEPDSDAARQYAPDLMVDEAVAWMRRHRDGPFLLCFMPTTPHLALQVPEDSIAPYRGLWNDPPYDGHQGYRPHPTPRAAYAAMISRLDRDVGRLVETLNGIGAGGNTLVLFTSDNGPTFDVGGADTGFFGSSGPLRGRKGSVFEGGIRVPLIAWWPGCVTPGRTSEHVSALWDVFPTLIDIAGARRPPGLDGLSFANEIRGVGDQPRHAYLFWEFPGYGGQQAVRLGEWKGIRRGMADGNTAVELYDLSVDIGESRNVAAEHPDIVRRIEEIMRSDREPSRAFHLAGLDPPR